MKTIKLTIIVVAVFAIGILLIYYVDYYSTPTTLLPDVPTISYQNCSSPARLCYFGLNNPDSDSTTTILKAELTINGAPISSLTSFPQIPKGKVTNVTIPLRTKIIISALVLIGFVAFFILPTVEITNSGQVTFLGIPFASEPTTCGNVLGCYCVGETSLSGWFLHIGYARFQCP